MRVKFISVQSAFNHSSRSRLKRIMHSTYWQLHHSGSKSPSTLSIRRMEVQPCSRLGDFLREHMRNASNSTGRLRSCELGAVTPPFRILLITDSPHTGKRNGDDGHDQ
jgi:hypothetical protein